MRWTVTLLLLCSPAPAVEMVREILLPAPCDTVISYLSGHEADLLATCHTRILTDDSSQELTAGEPRDVEVTIPGHRPLRLSVIAHEEMGGAWGTWTLRLAKPGGGLRSYSLSARCEPKTDATTSIRISANATSEPGRWKHIELAAGLSKMLRAFEAALRKEFPK